jgi:hypothetical protein
MIKRLHDAFAMARSHLKVLELMTRFDFAHRYMSSSMYAEFAKTYLSVRKRAWNE